jgi:hypothetical protein
VFRNAVIESVEKALEAMHGNPMEGRVGSGRSNDDLVNAPEMEEMIREMAERHWREWVETPVPALKDQTPREAAKTEKGRERLNALLLQFEYRGREPQPFDPDVDALRRELGLT